MVKRHFVTFCFVMSVLFAFTAVHAQTEVYSPEDVPPAVRAWIIENAVPFSTADPTAPDAELLPFLDMVGDARIVGLGEGTHGTSEFFQMKHRLLRLLVEEAGFRVFLMEAGLGEAAAVNDYIVNGVGTAEDVLHGLSYIIWNTDEILAMIEWMRAYNIAHPDDPVYFHGYDIQFHFGAVAQILDYLERINAPQYAAVADDLTCLGERDVVMYPAPTPDCAERLQALQTLFVEQRDAFTAASSPREYQFAAHVVDVLIDIEAYATLNTRDNTTRDTFMAENIIWFADQYFPDERIVVWAHNGHVRTSQFPYFGLLDLVADFYPMGKHLRERYGDDYITVGFAFGRGSITVQPILNDGQFVSIRPTPVLPLVDNSHEFFFQAAGMPRFMLDLRAGEGVAAVETWLRAPYALRAIGSAYYPDVSADVMAIPTLLAASFDVIIYFENSTPSRLN